MTAKASKGIAHKGVVDKIRALPRHKSVELTYPRAGFMVKLERLMADLDDVSEFVRLRTAGRYYVLTIRHR